MYIEYVTYKITGKTVLNSANYKLFKTLMSNFYVHVFYVLYIIYIHISVIEI